MSMSTDARVIDKLLNHLEMLQGKSPQRGGVMMNIGVDRARELDTALATLGLGSCSEADCQFLVQRIEDRIDQARVEPEEEKLAAVQEKTPTADLFSLLRIGRTLLSDDNDNSGTPTLRDLDFVRSFRQTGMMLIWTQLHQVLECQDMNQELTLDEFERGCHLLAASTDPMHTRYGDQGNVPQLCEYIQRCYEEELNREVASREVDSGIEMGKTDHYDSKLKNLFQVLGVDGANFNKIRLVMGIQQHFEDDDGDGDVMCDGSFDMFSKGVYKWANAEIQLRDRAGNITGPDILLACHKIHSQYQELKQAGKLPSSSGSPRHGIELGVRKVHSSATE